MTGGVRAASRLLLVGAVAVALLASGCGGDDDKQDSAPPSATSATSAPEETSSTQIPDPSKPPPERQCLLAADATHVTHPSSGVWTGTDPQIRIRRFRSAPQAKDAAASTSKPAAAVKRYVVIGAKNNPETTSAVKTVRICLERRGNR